MASTSPKTKKPKKKKPTVSSIDDLLPTKRVDCVKFLVDCKCILPQFKTVHPTVFHKFIVFVEINENAEIIPTYAECTNCGIVHRVTEVGTSEILNKELSNSVPKKDDIKLSLPDKLSGVLEKYNCDLPYWQEASFILRNELWGRGFVLSQERDNNKVFGKYVVLLGKDFFHINDFEREEGLV